MAIRIPIARPYLGKEEADAVVRVLESGMIAYGPEAQRFEEEFASYVGTDYAIAVTSGTVALDLVLKAYKIGPGDEVITTPFSFIATANAIIYQGARPVFVDIQPDTFNIDPDKVVEAITSRTRAIIAVHLYGHPAEMKPLREIAEDHDLVLIEDAAQAHGALYYGKKTGSLGDAAAFSFYATKNMTTGEGGMITTNDKKIAERVKKLRNHGQSGKYRHVTLGYNYLMSSIAATIGRVQLTKLDSMNQKRRANAELLTKGLSNIKGIVTPIEKPGVMHVYHQYVIRVTKESGVTRDQLAKKLNEAGIGTAVHYPRIIPDQLYYKKLGITCSSCIEARKAANEVLSLPVHPNVSKNDIEYIISKVKQIFYER